MGVTNWLASAATIAAPVESPFPHHRRRVAPEYLSITPRSPDPAPEEVRGRERHYSFPHRQRRRIDWSIPKK